VEPLSSFDVIAFVPTGDLARAKAFYKKVLGLHLVSEDANSLEFDANGTMLRIFHFTGPIPAHYTVLGWVVPDIDAMVEDLSAKGIVFEHYFGFEQNRAGVWAAPDGARVAWFKDPDGNILSLTQF
jgi:catechol 2,3-dioxygenase-like lactoylglutathione lyase family enzyme